MGVATLSSCIMKNSTCSVGNNVLMYSIGSKSVTSRGSFSLEKTYKELIYGKYTVI